MGSVFFIGSILIAMDYAMMKNKTAGRSLKRKILNEVNELPVMPKVVEKARELIMNPDAGMRELADLIEMDQSLAVKVLKLSNSAFFRRSGMVSSIRDAVVILGLNILYEIIIVASTAKLMNRKLKGYGLDAGQLWKHSISVGKCSQIIAGKTSPELIHNAFSAGLIHDCGKIVLDPYMYEKRDEYRKDIMKKTPWHIVERNLFGFDHALLASKILKGWRFPKNIRMAVCLHHAPKRLFTSKLAYIIHVADQIALWSLEKSSEIDPSIIEEPLKVLGISFEDIGDIMENTVSYVNEVESVFT